MGSKRAMLENGLGDLLEREVGRAPRFVDLFAGSGSVAIHVARRFPIPVVALDLQRYSAILTAAVICRQEPLHWQLHWDAWLRRAGRQVDAAGMPNGIEISHEVISKFRAWCAKQTGLPVTRAYGGHYFSPRQTVWIDALRSSLPMSEPAKTVALAALIQAASLCAAAPGHTAQPFRLSPSARRYIYDAWKRDIADKTKAAFEILAGQFAQRPGRARVGDANQAAKRLQEGDLTFIDPPYSSSQYSRFYHVLETIAFGSCGPVTGVGRYPAPELRPRSKYSVVSESAKALVSLLSVVASRRARAILTFPNHRCSNGLSGSFVRDSAARYFFVYEQQVYTRFSTLGGTGDDRGDEAGRSPRRDARELIFVLKPK